tara:strand:+ start:3692 stop:5203 length:1512 start_codon:yes stop_codon:yes gene_type:complete
MSKRLIPLTIDGPGIFGLNTQQAGNVLPVGWATKLMNVTYDDVGRVASRKGSRRLTTTTIPAPVKSIHEYVDRSGSKVNIFAADNKIYKEVSGTITDISGSITTPTDDHWRFQNFNGLCVGYQAEHDPIVLATVGGTFADEDGTMHAGSTVLSAYGRTWTVVDSTLYYSDLLIHDYAGGSTGSFDLSNFWPNGMDEATALADFNGFLIVFGKESILLYQNADDISNMSIYEGITGMGCIARDSVQSVGKDLVFLSSTGLRSLGRALEAGTMPLTDLSAHVRDSLIQAVAVGSSGIIIKSVYNRDEGFYCLSLPGAGTTYVFDLKFPNQDGTWRASQWDYAPTAFYYTEGLRMLMGTENFLTEYKDYLDNNAVSGTGGTTYQLDYEGVWNDFGEEVANAVKIPKSVSVLGSGTSGSDVTFKWAMNYMNTYYSRSLSFNSVVPAQYGVATYGVSVYGSSGGFERSRSQLSSTGQVMKSGIIVTINNHPFALQRIDVLAKLGKLGI